MTIEAGQYTNITALQNGKGISNVTLSGTVGQPLFYQSSTNAVSRLVNSSDLNTTNTPSGGQCLTYGSNGQGTWAACATVTGGTGNVTSSNGSANYIPVFSNSTNLVTGSLRDNGSFVNVSGNYIVGADNYAFLAFLNNSNSTNVTTVNWNNGSLQKVNLNASSVTINFVAPQSGVNRLTLLLQQDSTGSRVPTFNGSTIKWAGAAAPTFTTTANRADIVTCLYDGVNSTGNYYCVASLNFG